MTVLTPTPKPPEQKATPEQIAKGALVYEYADCVLCHGVDAVGLGKRALDGAVPDLRYMTPKAHRQWRSIVLGGRRGKAGMPGYSKLMSVDDSESLQAYVIEQSWKAYKAQQRQND